VDDCRILELPRLASHAGSITPVEGASDVPFEIARVYFLYDVVAGASRGGHAHRQLEQVIVAVMGACTVALDDGSSRRKLRLDQADRGLYVPRLVWRELAEFSSGSICVVLASLPYDEREYIRDYEAFRRAVGSG
jgi:hypothetical protein